MRRGHVALLRGINVGGKNPVPMAALRTTFEEGGFDDVRVYYLSFADWVRDESCPIVRD